MSKMIKIKKERVLITPQDIKPSSKDFEILGTFNPGAARLSNGDIILYVRVMEKLVKSEDERYCYSPRFMGEDNFRIELDRFDKNLLSRKSDLDFIFKDGTKRLTFISYLRRVILDKTGFKIKSIDKKPSFFGFSWDGELGIEDPRITKINDIYVMTYVSLSREGNISTSYALSNDCINWYRRGIMFGEQDKDIVVFPERINNQYISFDRPEGSFEFTPPHLWIAYSDDLESWKNHSPLPLSKKGEWDYGKIGAGPPPIRTDRGWLLLYHTVKVEGSLINITEKTLEPESSYEYYVGAALFDLKNPKKLIAKSKSPIIAPNKKYERGTAEYKGVVFPTGIVADKNNKDLLIFSGGGDRVVTVKKVALSDIFNKLEKI